MKRRGAIRRSATLATFAAGLALLATGCGEAQRDAGEAKADYPLEVVRTRFPRQQAIARDTQLELVVRNAGTHTIPDVAATVDSFYYTSDYPHLSIDKRPVWIVNDGPGARANPPVESEQVDSEGGGATAFVNTWALGALAAGQQRTFLWKVTPVKAGTFSVRYTFAAGIDGRARAVLPGGGAPTGTLVAQIAPVPPHTHVNPGTGRIAAGSNPASPTAVGAVP